MCRSVGRRRWGDGSGRRFPAVLLLLLVGAVGAGRMQDTVLDMTQVLPPTLSDTFMIELPLVGITKGKSPYRDLPVSPAVPNTAPPQSTPGVTVKTPEAEASSAAGGVVRRAERVVRGIAQRGAAQRHDVVSIARSLRRRANQRDARAHQP
jgi:hypothetical protein